MIEFVTKCSFLNLWPLFAKLLAVILVLLWGGYRVYMAYSIRREADGRLRNEQVRAALAEVRRAGSADAPAVLLLHGFGGSPADFLPLLERLPESLTVHAPILPGHSGTSAESLAGITRLQMEEAVLAEAETLLERHDSLLIIGFSYGGILALRLAEELPLCGLILINPYVGVPYKPYYLFPVSFWRRSARPFLPYVRKLRSGQINDPEGRAEYIPSYLNISLAAANLMDAHSADILRKVQPLGIPVHVHISEGDVVSSPEKVKALCAKLAIPADHIQVWKRSNHVLLYDHDADAAIKEILKTIEHFVQIDAETPSDEKADNFQENRP